MGKDRFALAVNKRDWWTLTQAVAKGDLTATPDGTRVSGQAGLPPWMTWMLRFASIFAVLAGAGGAAAVAMDTGAGGAMVWAPLMLCFVLVTAVMGIGLNVKNANDQVPELMSRLEDVARGRVQAATDDLADAETISDADRKRRAAAAAAAAAQQKQS